MRAKLTLKSGKTDFIFLNQATIGSSSDCTIVIPGLSPRHARIRFSTDENGFVIESLSDGGSVQVEGRPVGSPERLLSGQNIELGGTDVTFRLMSDSDLDVKPSVHEEAVPRQRVERKAERPEQRISGDQKTIAAEKSSVAAGAGQDVRQSGKTPGAARDPFVIKAQSAARDELFLEVTEGSRPHTHKLSPGENIIGRAPECTIVLQDPSISRRHASIVLGEGRALLKDLGSKNHTFVNRERIVGEVELRPDALIRFGLVEARIIRSVLMEAGV